MVRSVSSARVTSLTPPRASSARRRNAPTAPGTVGMHSARSNRRRSRLKPTTYSMCCQRPSRPPRLTTLALPETAPTRGSAKGCTSVRTVPGSKTVSPSTMTTSSHEAAASPVLSAAGLPAFRCRITRTPGRRSDSTRSAVPSVEPSSTTMISTGWSEASSERTAASIPALSLYAGTMTLTCAVTGGPQERPRSPVRSRRCRRAAISTTAARSTLIAPATHISTPSSHTVQSPARSSPMRAMPCSWSPGPARRSSPAMPTEAPTVANRKP